jgi:hypothetical protein
MSVHLNRLQARLGHDLYVPVAFRVAFGWAELPWAKAVADAPAAADALRRFQRHIQADGVLPWFDGWLEAEAAGARAERDAHGRVVGTPAPPRRLPSATDLAEAPQIRAVLEITRILCAETREQSTVVGCVTGVRTLAARLIGHRPAPGATVEPAAIEIACALARAFCEAGVGALMMVADLPMGEAADARNFAPITAVAREFGIPTILMSRHPVSTALEGALHAAGVDHISAPGGHDSVCAIPSAMLRAAPEASDGWFTLQRRAKPAPRLFVSEWEVPPDARIATLVALRHKVAR